MDRKTRPISLPNALRLCLPVVILCTGGLFSGAVALAQNGAQRLQVYLDCDECDDDHIRTEITWVDYVRDQELAEVHIFVTTTRTVLSGEQYEFSFIGRGDFDAMQYTYTRTVDQSATNDEEREIVNEAIRVGLVPFVTQMDPEAFTVHYDRTDARNAEESPERDAWRHWTFTFYGGDLEVDLESNREVYDSRWGFFADHHSEEWKIRIRPYFNYDVYIVRREGRDDIRSSIARHGFDGNIIKSLGAHWSAALFGTYITRNDRNLRHQGELQPGVEYSFLPYAEATRRTITLSYLLGVTYSDYYEVTIFDVKQEWLPRHEIDFSVALRRPWGDIYGGVEVSQYLHDTSVLSAEFGGAISVRLFEGFSLQVEGEYEMIRDQLTLPKGDASLSEILLQQRELATDYAFSSSIAFTYTFGSRFANVVNTRF